MSEAHRAHPDRFVALATLPMQDPRRSVEELDRAARLPGVRGDLLEKLGRAAEAREEFLQAAALAGNARERALMEERARALQDGAG